MKSTKSLSLLIVALGLLVQCDKATGDRENAVAPITPTQTRLASGEVCLFLFTPRAPRPELLQALAAGSLDGRKFQVVTTCPAGVIRFACAPESDQPMPTERAIFETRGTYEDAAKLCAALSRGFGLRTALATMVEVEDKQGDGRTFSGSIVARFTP
jgi:hypothetical protein